MTQELKLPELGDGIQRATIAVWHFQVGDQVRAGDDVVEVVTDKAVFNVAADRSGKLEQILVVQGQDAQIGQTLAVIR